MATVSASRLCISTTSTPRSRILVMKSKWSRLALSTHSTSSNSRSSQLDGRQALMRAARRADHDLAQLADFGMHAEGDVDCFAMVSCLRFKCVMLPVSQAVNADRRSRRR